MPISKLIISVDTPSSPHTTTSHRRAPHISPTCTRQLSKIILFSSRCVTFFQFPFSHLCFTGSRHTRRWGTNKSISRPFSGRLRADGPVHVFV